MKQEVTDKADQRIDRSDRKLEVEKERLEIKLRELEKSANVSQAVQDGNQLRQKIVKAMKNGDYDIKPLGIRDTPIERISIDGPLKTIPPEAKRRVIRDVELMREIQDMRARGLTDEEIHKMGAEYKDVHQRFFQPHVDNIKGTEYEGRVLIDSGRTHAAYAAEMGLRDIPVATHRLEVSEEKRLNLEFEEKAGEAPLYRKNPSRLRWMQEFEKSLGHAEGFAQTRHKTLSENIDSARGHFSELARAYRVQEAGLRVEALDKSVETRLGRTDIDILARRKDGTYIWIENKDVKQISNDQNFREKIDKMAAGLKDGVEIEPGRRIRIDRAVFVNTGHISPEAMGYARSKNIIIEEKLSAGKKFRDYIAEV